MKALLIHLEAPLQSYGAEAVDSRRPIREMPGSSMIVGLLANAMGYRRTEEERLGALQSRLTYAARLDRPGERLRDFQTAQLSGADVMWTTEGVQGRGGGAETHDNPVLRTMEYWSDRLCLVAVALADGDGPSIEDLGEALRAPRRPLHIGRKCCLPSEPLFAGYRDGNDLREILLAEPLRDIRSDGRILLQSDAPVEGWTETSVTDRCDWVTRFFGGSRSVWQGYVDSSVFGKATP